MADDGGQSFPVSSIVSQASPLVPPGLDSGWRAACRRNAVCFAYPLRFPPSDHRGFWLGRLLRNAILL